MKAGRAFCPACGAALRLDAEAREETRAHSARCDRGIDLGARALAIQRSGGLFPVLIAVSVLFLAHHGADEALAVGAGALCLRLYAGSIRSTVRVDGDALVLGVGPCGLWRRRFARADVRDASVKARAGHYYAVVELLGGRTLRVGRFLGLSLDAAAFLRDEILSRAPLVGRVRIIR